MYCVRFIVMALVSTLSASLFAVQSVTAEEIVESISRFKWKEVPKTSEVSELGNPNAEHLLWAINVARVVRKGYRVDFEAVSPQAEYVRFFGNCQTNKISIQYTGSFTIDNKVSYWYYPNPWNKATGTHGTLLNFACSQR